MKTLLTVLALVSVEFGWTAWTAAAAADRLIYKRVAERELKLFIEKPADWKATDKRPCIVFFFGGGWVGGTPEQFRKQSEYLATRGMVGIRVEYRTIPKAAPPAIVFLGDSDKLIPVSVLRDFEAEMNKAGVRCEALVYPAAGHGFFNRPPYFTLTLIETDKFLASLGWLEGPPTSKAPGQ